MSALKVSPKEFSDGHFVPILLLVSTGPRNRKHGLECAQFAGHVSDVAWHPGGRLNE